MTPYASGKRWTLYAGDCLDVLRGLEAGSAHCCVTSPPYYGLRDYGHDGQIGLEDSPEEYVAKLVKVFREVRRVLRDDGTVWLNLGDSYAANRPYQVPSTKGGPKHSDSQSAGGHASTVPAGLKPKDLIGIPWRVAFALQADGWYLRSDIIWHKSNPMPESVTDRCTKAHEYVFLLSKSARYYYDADAIREPHATPEDHRATKQGASPLRGQEAIRARGNLETCGTPEERYYAAGGRNKRSVWTIATQPYAGAHFAVMPPDLVEPCILAGCPVDGLVIDPFTGSGTVGEIALVHGRCFIGAELNADYADLATCRLERASLVGVQAGLFAGGSR